LTHVIASFFGGGGQFSTATWGHFTTGDDIRYMFTTMTGANGRGEDPTRLYRINAGATWIATNRLPSMIFKAAFYSSTEKQPSSWLPEWKA
jgi:hypothetical protein